MAEIEIGGSLREALSEVARAWTAAERGEAFTPVDKVVFVDDAVFAAVMTPKRRALLAHLRREPEPGLRALARALGRDASTVHGDVRALVRAGLVDLRPDGSLATDVDEVACAARVKA